MSKKNPISLTDSFLERHAAKSFDGSTLSEQNITDLHKALKLAPSSFGLQPWHFVIVRDPEVKAKLAPLAYNQPQITTCSELIVICAKKPTPELIQEFISDVAQKRGLEVSALDGYKGMIEGSVASLSSEQALDWAKRQCYIALGFVLAQAAALGVDSCPMEGFDRDGFDQVLGLQDTCSVVICPIGKANDQVMPKVRFDDDKLFTTI